MHILVNFTQAIEKLMVSHGNVNLFSQMLNELCGDSHFQVEELYWNQAAFDTGKELKRNFLTFMESLGKIFPK